MQALGVRIARCRMTVRALCERGCPQHAGFPRTPLESPTPKATAPLDCNALRLRAAFDSRPRSATSRHGSCLCRCSPRVLAPPPPGTKLHWSLRSRAARSALASRAADSASLSAMRDSGGNF